MSRPEPTQSVAIAPLLCPKGVVVELKR
jgi:hypothetical protein